MAVRQLESQNDWVKQERDKTTKLETVLFNILQFLLAVEFAWFSTRAIVRGEFEGSLKRFAVALIAVFQISRT
jgi:hypothetical protein